MSLPIQARLKDLRLSDGMIDLLKSGWKMLCCASWRHTRILSS